MVRPSTISMTMYGTDWPPTKSSPESYTATIAWWLRPATDWASRVKRALEVGSSARSARSSLTATVRPRRTSSAAKTSAMPPRPSLRVSRYRPSPTSPPFPHISGASDIPPPVASGSDGP